MAKKTTAARNPEARKARRVTIARGIIEQKSTPQLAKELGISRVQVWNELQHPETKALIQGWMQPHHEAIKRMIPRALATVNKGMKPSQEMRDRLNAVKTLGTVMEWAEGTRKDGDSNGKPLRWSGELVELLAMYARFPAPEA